MQELTLQEIENVSGGFDAMSMAQGTAFCAQCMVRAGYGVCTNIVSVGPYVLISSFVVSGIVFYISRAITASLVNLIANLSGLAVAALTLDVLLKNARYFSAGNSKKAV